MDKINTDQPAFVSNLLMKNDLITVHHILQTCHSHLLYITELKNMLFQLELAVDGNLYSRGIKLANEIRTKFDIYKKYTDTDYIGELFKKYKEVLSLIKQKLLDEIDPTKQEKLNDQIVFANDLIELLSEDEKNKFLQDMSLKICITIPKGKFIEKCDEHLQWIRDILEKDTKYKLLDKWNLKKYVIEEWAKQISKLIFDDTSKLTINLLETVKSVEEYLKQYYENPEDLLAKSFDKFCIIKMKEIFKKFVMPEMNMEADTNIYRSSAYLLSSLKELDKAVVNLINKRNIKLLTDFHKEQINKHIDIFSQYYKENFTLYFTNDNIIKTRNTIKYIDETIIKSLKKRYDIIELKDFKIEQLKHEISDMIYEEYKKKCLKFVDDTFNKYQIGKIKSLIGIININNKTQNDDVNSNKITDVSDEIHEIINILKFMTEYTKDFDDIRTAASLLIEISQYYKTKTDIDSLMKYNSEIYNQIIMDLCYLGNNFKITTQNIFLDITNRMNILEGKIHKNEIFIEQFKLFYQNHNVDLLQKILKLKNIDHKNEQMILKIYGDDKLKKQNLNPKK